MGTDRLHQWSTVMDGRTQQTLEYDWPRIVRHLPVMEMDHAAHHQVLPFWRRIIGHPEKDAFWSGGDATPALERLEIPVLQAGGWYDPFLPSTLLGFTGPDRVWNASGPERARRLVVGPWRHGGNGGSETGEVDFGPQAAVDLDALNLRFAAHVLSGERGDDVLPALLRIFVMGENRWRDEREWPLARAKPTPLYLASGGRANTLDGNGLLTWKQPASAPPDRFVYDPSIPSPPVAGTSRAPPRTSRRGPSTSARSNSERMSWSTPRSRSARPSRSPDRSKSCCGPLPMRATPTSRRSSSMSRPTARRST
jgi:putative CocE/NonD family hydrolase